MLHPLSILFPVQQAKQAIQGQQTIPKKQIMHTTHPPQHF